jgi:hypothetical protein
VAGLLGLLPPRGEGQRAIGNGQTAIGNGQGAGDGKNAQLPTPNTEHRTPNDEDAKRAALERFINGKSQRDVLQLWAEGGSRPGRVKGAQKLCAPARRKTDEEILAEKRAEAAQALMTARNCMRALTTDLGRHLNPVSARSLLIDIRNDIKVIAAALESI